MTDASQGATTPQDSPISGLVDRAQTLASNVASNAQDTALRMAEEQKAAAADQVADVARVLDTAAEQVERVLPEAAHYVREAASGVHRVSSAVRDQSIEDIIGMAMTFARTRPATFLAGSVVAGFALARFLKSSADRRLETASSSPTRGQRRSGAKKSGSRTQAGRSSAPRGAQGGGKTSNTDAPAAGRQE
jgi:hypothetical protein